MRFNVFHWGIIHGLAWVVCLAHGSILHNNVLFGIGLFFLFYSLRMIIIKTPENDDFTKIEMEAYMKRQNKKIISSNHDEDDDIQVYKRPWRGLTDVEYQEILIKHDSGKLILFYDLVEAKLKSKNS